jgi:hypothetical protein
LKKIGFVEGQNVAIEYRWADGETRRWFMASSKWGDRGLGVDSLVGDGAESASSEPCAITSGWPRWRPSVVIQISCRSPSG